MGQLIFERSDLAQFPCSVPLNLTPQTLNPASSVAGSMTSIQSAHLSGSSHSHWGTVEA